MRRTANYAEQKKRAAEFVNKAVATALVAGPPPTDNDPPVSKDGWSEEPYDGQEKFIRTAIDHFKTHAPAISMDIPAPDFPVWPPVRVYVEAAKLSRWNKQSASMTPMGMFVARHAFWRFIAASIVYRKRMKKWPGVVWTALGSLRFDPISQPHDTVQRSNFIKAIHDWSDSYLRAAGVI